MASGTGQPLPEILRPFALSPRRAAVFVDYDGTLAPIVADPARAVPFPGAVEALVRLGARFGLVAVVSGRPVAYLQAVLGPMPGVRFVGLYGMEEIDGDGSVAVPAAVEAWRKVVEAVTARAVAGAPAGLGVEPKGLTVTLHWRSDPAGEGWARRFADHEHQATGLVAHPGRMSLELRPPLGIDKGSVVRQLGGDFGAVAYLGDDLGDLPAFDALGDLAAKGATVARVAVVDDESAPEVAAAADLVVGGPGEAVALLGQLAD